MQLLAKWRICAVLQKIGKGGISAFSSSIPSAPAKEKSVNTPFADFFVLISAVKNLVLVTIW